MSSLFNTTINSFDEQISNDIELYSITGTDYLDKRDKYLTTEKGYISIGELMKIFPNNTLILDNPVSNGDYPLFNVLKQKKRGRQIENSKKSQHSSTDFDNIERKIQVHFFTFIINLSNDAVKAVLGSKIPNKFKQIDYKLKIKISHKDVKILHSSAIKDILEMQISPKNKKISKSINNDILNIVCKDSKLLENFFNIKYLKFFYYFYFNEEKETNKIVFEGQEIPFSKETKNFYHLLKKYENYKTLLSDSVKRVYFYGYDALIRNNSFVTFKNNIELKESDN